MGQLATYLATLSGSNLIAKKLRQALFGSYKEKTSVQSEIFPPSDADLKALLGGIKNYKVYSALLTQIAPAQTSSGTLVVGRKYILTDWLTDDDFLNVGAAANEDAQVFVATGTTPTKWTNSSLVDSYGEPVATILENTLSAVPLWEYTSAGLFTLTLTAEFTAAKTFLFVNDNLAPDAGKIYAKWTSANVITLYTDVTNGTATDNLLTGVEFEIRVYP